MPRFGLSSERELAYSKPCPNKNDYVGTKTEINERNFAQSVRLALCSGAYLE
jgi:hypothetical protein